MQFDLAAGLRCVVPGTHPRRLHKEALWVQHVLRHVQEGFIEYLKASLFETLAQLSLSAP